MAESIFDREAEPGRYFYCDNGQVFRSIKELKNTLSTCYPEYSKYLFDRYNPDYKNDFANWIKGVFFLNELAARLNPVKDPVAFLKVLNDYEKEEEEKITREKQTTSEKEREEEEKRRNQEIKAEETKNKSGQEDGEYLKNQISERLDRADQQFDRVKKIKQNSFYNKAEFEDTVEDLKSRYEEIVHSISEHRKEGKDMSIPAMLARNLLPKINYFQVGQNRADHERIIELFDEIEKEINYSKQLQATDLRDEVMREAGLVRPKAEE